MRPSIYALWVEMGEVKGGDFASHGNFCRMAGAQGPKKHQSAPFFGRIARKEKPGDERPRAQKA